MWYRYLWSERGPWAVYLVEADLTRCDLALAVLQAEANEAGHADRETVTSMAARHAGAVLAAVNGDFFTPGGRTAGSQVVRGRVIVARERPVLAWRRGSSPWIGQARVLADTALWAGWSVSLRRGDGLTEAVSGFPELLAEGARVGDLGVAELPGFAATRHPRTAVAYDVERERLWLVVVDGRRPTYSVGMTLPELTALLQALAVEEALNLDGGGSSVVAVRNRVVSRPSDDDGERAVVNALAVVHEPGACGARR